jgi:hypothetical protein
MTGKKLSLYEQGHLVVSAIRLHFHRAGKFPSAEDISSMTGFSVEVTHLLCNQLIDGGILRVVGGAFDQRFEVKDHLKIEDLPRSIDDGAMEREIEEYRAEKQDKQKKIDEMFDKREFEKQRQEQLKKIEEQFKDHAKKKKTDPFGPPSKPDG